jgi:hypothetical protein
MPKTHYATNSHQTFFSASLIQSTSHPSSITALPLLPTNSVSAGFLAAMLARALLVASDDGIEQGRKLFGTDDWVLVTVLITVLADWLLFCEHRASKGRNFWLVDELNSVVLLC